jgi:hypothetical protein
MPSARSRACRRRPSGYRRPRLPRRQRTRRSSRRASAERGCRENCRQLLQGQVDAAAAEIRDAQAALADLKTKAERELADARRAFDGIKRPQSATPFADRVGVAPWALDLLRSALGSIAANGLACCLLIFGAHHAVPRVEIVTPVPVARRPQPAMAVTPKPVADLKQHAAQFALACLTPGGEADIFAIRDRYPSWCPPGERRSEAEIGQALAALFNGAGIDVIERDGRLIAVGVSLRPGTHPAP